MYFSELKVAVEIDEKGHTDRKQDEENKRQKRKKKKRKKEKHSNCNFFHRIYPDAEGFDISFEISKMKVALLNQIRKKEKKKRKSN